MAQATAVRFQSVSVRYGERTILDAIDLDIPARAITCLIGLSGAGKSTILRLINGLREPTSGTVVVDGLALRAITRKQLVELRRTIGFSFQFAALFDSLTIYDNVALPLRETTTLSEAEIRARVEEALDLVGLDAFAESMPSELSGGMIKRAGFARAVITRPHIVLYDEPTTGLDPIMTNALTRTIRNLQQRDRSTCVVISHDMTSIRRMADYVAMLYEGRIIAFGTLAEIDASNDPRVRQFLEGSVEGPIAL